MNRAAMVVSPMPCDDRMRLLDAYMVAVDHHALTVRELPNTYGKGVVFKEALTKAEQAGEDAETARLALRDHMESHGC